MDSYIVVTFEPFLDYYIIEWNISAVGKFPSLNDIKQVYFVKIVIINNGLCGAVKLNTGYNLNVKHQV